MYRKHIIQQIWSNLKLKGRSKGQVAPDAPSGRNSFNAICSAQKTPNDTCCATLEARTFDNWGRHHVACEASSHAQRKVGTSIPKNTPGCKDYRVR